MSLVDESPLHKILILPEFNDAPFCLPPRFFKVFFGLIVSSRFIIYYFEFIVQFNRVSNKIKHISIQTVSFFRALPVNITAMYVDVRAISFNYFNCVSQNLCFVQRFDECLKILQYLLKVQHVRVLDNNIKTFINRME